MALFQQSLTKQKPVSLEDPEAFARFYDQYHLSVFRYSMVLCAGNQLEAEDMTAQAFLRAWEKRGQFSGTESAALGWVITIARNALIDQRRVESSAAPEMDLTDELADETLPIEQILVAEQQMQQVLDAIHCLPLRQQDIFTLRYVLGWRVNAIAAHLALAENTISVDLRRALKKIQDQLFHKE